MKNLLLLTFFIYGTALAGGDSRYIDPFNGCFAVPTRHTDGMEVVADFINHRGKYLQMLDESRKEIMAMCWEKKARCVRIPTVCRKSGTVVYEGFTWYWR